MSDLRDQIAEALYEWALSHTVGGVRHVTLGVSDEPLRENSRARADAVMRVIEHEVLRIEVDATQRADTLAAQLQQAREIHRQTCPLATGTFTGPAYTCSMCTALDQPKEAP